MPEPRSSLDSSSVSGQQEAAKKEVVEIYRDLRARHPGLRLERLIVVSVERQQLILAVNGVMRRSYPVSTSRYGTGSECGSERTPLGVHKICAKIGSDSLEGTVFKGRVPTGQIIPPNAVEEADQDFITSRILWLDGLEPGCNRGGNLDSKDRFIYIHGTHAERAIGTPASHGCIRMRNADVIDLYDRVNEDDVVYINP